MSPEEIIAKAFLKLPVVAIARAIAERADSLGLVWKLRPATLMPPSPSGQLQIMYDGDSVTINAVSLIGRLPVGARVMCVVTPPAGNHIIGFLGADFPPSVPGEAIGRPRVILLEQDWSTPPSSTALTDVTGMTFPIAPLGRYVIRLRASNNGDAAADIKYSWTIPSGASMDRYIISLPTAETTNFNPTTWSTTKRIHTDSQPNANTSATPPSTGFPGYWEDIMVKAGATGGAVQLTAGQNVSNATPSVIRQFSYMEVQRYR